MIYDYARISTATQDVSGQLAQLKAAGCAEVFREKDARARIAKGETQRGVARSYNVSQATISRR